MEIEKNKVGRPTKTDEHKQLVNQKYQNSYYELVTKPKRVLKRIIGMIKNDELLMVTVSPEVYIHIKNHSAAEMRGKELFFYNKNVLLDPGLTKSTASFTKTYKNYK